MNILEVQRRIDILIEIFYNGDIEALLADINMNHKDFLKIFIEANMFYVFQVRLSIRLGISQNWLMLGRPPILLKNIFNYQIVQNAEKIVNNKNVDKFFLL